MNRRVVGTASLPARRLNALELAQRHLDRDERPRELRATGVSPTILFGVIYDSLFILGIGLLCSVFDVACVGLLI